MAKHISSSPNKAIAYSYSPVGAPPVNHVIDGEARDTEMIGKETTIVHINKNFVSSPEQHVATTEHHKTIVRQVSLGVMNERMKQREDSAFMWSSWATSPVTVASATISQRPTNNDDRSNVSNSCANAPVIDRPKKGENVFWYRGVIRKMSASTNFLAASGSSTALQTASPILNTSSPKLNTSSPHLNNSSPLMSITLLKWSPRNSRSLPRTSTLISAQNGFSNKERQCMNITADSSSTELHEPSVLHKTLSPTPPRAKQLLSLSDTDLVSPSPPKNLRLNNTAPDVYGDGHILHHERHRHFEWQLRQQGYPRDFSQQKAQPLNLQPRQLQLHGIEIELDQEHPSQQNECPVQGDLNIHLPPNPSFAPDGHNSATNSGLSDGVQGNPLQSTYFTPYLATESETSKRAGSEQRIANTDPPNILQDEHELERLNYLLSSPRIETDLRQEHKDHVDAACSGGSSSSQESVHLSDEARSSCSSAAIYKTGGNRPQLLSDEDQNKWEISFPFNKNLAAALPVVSFSDLISLAHDFDACFSRKKTLSLIQNLQNSVWAQQNTLENRACVTIDVIPHQQEVNPDSASETAQVNGNVDHDCGYRCHIAKQWQIPLTINGFTMAESYQYPFETNITPPSVLSRNTNTLPCESESDSSYMSVCQQKSVNSSPYETRNESRKPGLSLTTKQHLVYSTSDISSAFASLKLSDRRQYSCIIGNEGTVSSASTVEMVDVEEEKEKRKESSKTGEMENGEKTSKRIFPKWRTRAKEKKHSALQLQETSDKCSEGKSESKSARKVKNAKRKVSRSATTSSPVQIAARRNEDGSSGRSVKNLPNLFTRKLRQAITLPREFFKMKFGRGKEHAKASCSATKADVDEIATDLVALDTSHSTWFSSSLLDNASCTAMDDASSASQFSDTSQYTQDEWMRFIFHDLKHRQTEYVKSKKTRTLSPGLTDVQEHSAGVNKEKVAMNFSKQRSNKPEQVKADASATIMKRQNREFMMDCNDSSGIVLILKQSSAESSCYRDKRHTENKVIFSKSDVGHLIAQATERQTKGSDVSFAGVKSHDPSTNEACFNNTKEKGSGSSSSISMGNEQTGQLFNTFGSGLQQGIPKFRNNASKIVKTRPRKPVTYMEFFSDTEEYKQRVSTRRDRVEISSQERVGGYSKMQKTFRKNTRGSETKTENLGLLMNVFTGQPIGKKRVYRPSSDSVDSRASNSSSQSSSKEVQTDDELASGDQNETVWTSPTVVTTIAHDRDSNARVRLTRPCDSNTNVYSQRRSDAKTKSAMSEILQISPSLASKRDCSRKKSNFFKTRRFVKKSSGIKDAGTLVRQQRYRPRTSNKELGRRSSGSGESDHVTTDDSPWFRSKLSRKTTEKKRTSGSGESDKDTDERACMRNRSTSTEKQHKQKLRGHLSTPVLLESKRDDRHAYSKSGLLAKPEDQKNQTSGMSNCTLRDNHRLKTPQGGIAATSITPTSENDASANNVLAMAQDKRPGLLQYQKHAEEPESLTFLPQLLGPITVSSASSSRSSMAEPPVLLLEASVVPVAARSSDAEICRFVTIIEDWCPTSSQTFPQRDPETPNSPPLSLYPEAEEQDLISYTLPSSKVEITSHVEPFSQEQTTDRTVAVESQERKNNDGPSELLLKCSMATPHAESHDVSATSTSSSWKKRMFSSSEKSSSDSSPLGLAAEPSTLQQSTQKVRGREKFWELPTKDALVRSHDSSETVSPPSSSRRSTSCHESLTSSDNSLALAELHPTLHTALCVYVHTGEREPYCDDVQNGAIPGNDTNEPSTRTAQPANSPGSQTTSTIQQTIVEQMQRVVKEHVALEFEGFQQMLTSLSKCLDDTRKEQAEIKKALSTLALQRQQQRRDQRDGYGAREQLAQQIDNSKSR